MKNTGINNKILSRTDYYLDLDHYIFQGTVKMTIIMAEVSTLHPNHLRISRADVVMRKNNEDHNMIITTCK